MLRKILSSFFLGAILILVFFSLDLALAQAPAPATAPTPTGLQKANTGLTNVGAGVFGADKTPQPIEKVVGNIIQTGLTLVGVIFLVLTVYGGYIWMAARGEEAEVEHAKKIIKNAVIGLAVVAGAYAVTAFVTARLLAASGLPA